MCIYIILCIYICIYIVILLWIYFNVLCACTIYCHGMTVCRKINTNITTIYHYIPLWSLYAGLIFDESSLCICGICGLKATQLHLLESCWTSGCHGKEGRWDPWDPRDPWDPGNSGTPGIRGFEVAARFRSPLLSPGTCSQDLYSYCTVIAKAWHSGTGTFYIFYGWK